MKGIPVVKDGVLRPGEDCAEVFFEFLIGLKA